MELSKEELQDLIISLERDLFVAERNAHIHGVVDDRMINLRSVLTKARNKLNKASD